MKGQSSRVLCRRIPSKRPKAVATWTFSVLLKDLQADIRLQIALQMRKNRSLRVYQNTKQHSARTTSCRGRVKTKILCSKVKLHHCYPPFRSTSLNKVFRHNTGNIYSNLALQQRTSINRKTPWHQLSERLYIYSRWLKFCSAILNQRESDLRGLTAVQQDWSSFLNDCHEID